MSEPEKPKFWFPAKRFGWGWGLPVRWEGWAVLCTYIGLTVGGIRLLGPDYGPDVLWIYLATITILLIAVCWWKGEKPSWRWGERPDRDRAEGTDSPGS